MPIVSVTTPSDNRPTAMPIQNPDEHRLEKYNDAPRARVMNETIQPEIEARTISIRFPSWDCGVEAQTRTFSANVCQEVGGTDPSNSIPHDIDELSLFLR